MVEINDVEMKEADQTTTPNTTATSKDANTLTLDGEFKSDFRLSSRISFQ